VAEIDGVAWIDDSKATNPNAASAGLAAMARPTVLLAGGSDKGSDFGAYGALVRRETRAVVLFGETRRALAAAIGPDHPVTIVDDLAAAVEVAGQLARPGDAVLLSPACASFDQFRDFVHRGRVFQELVQARAGSAATPVRDPGRPGGSSAETGDP
jgi:UDP-N-acetylmuramoylalanine--D-glutamate ligase